MAKRRPLPPLPKRPKAKAKPDTSRAAELVLAALLETKKITIADVRRAGRLGYQLAAGTSAEMRRLLVVLRALDRPRAQREADVIALLDETERLDA